LATIAATGTVIGFYGVLKFYGLDPFGVRVAGPSVVSSFGNPIFMGAFLLMVEPVILAWALKSNVASVSPARIIWWVIPLTILVLAMVFTQARGPWKGLAAGLTVFFAFLGIAVGWRASLRSLAMSGAAIGLTWAIVTFVPAQSGKVDLGLRRCRRGER
jgi:hypothetical protein